MVENAKCPKCHNKRTVTCPCCAGRGWVVSGLVPPQLSKAYTCADCSGFGEIPCPTCRPAQKDSFPQKVRVKRTRLRFGWLKAMRKGWVRSSRSPLQPLDTLAIAPTSQRFPEHPQQHGAWKPIQHCRLTFVRYAAFL